jgi:2'-5' RNA ligase
MRLFFALWPDKAAVEAIQTIQAGLAPHCGGRSMRREQLHVTLAFLGEVPDAAARPLPALLENIAARRFVFRLNRFGNWFPPGLVWMGSEQMDPALADLKADLDHGLKGCGFAVEERAFRPHLTLFRNAERRAPPGVCDISWVVNEVTLVRSEPSQRGSHYEVIARRAIA